MKKMVTRKVKVIKKSDETVCVKPLKIKREGSDDPLDDFRFERNNLQRQKTFRNVIFY